MSQHITTISCGTFGATASCSCTWTQTYNVGDQLLCDGRAVRVTEGNAEEFATLRARIHRLITGVDSEPA